MQTLLPILSDHLEEIAALCRAHHVRRLDVFGSAARQVDFDYASSDIDFLVEYEESAWPIYVENQDSLEEGLVRLMRRDIDLVTFKWVRNPYIRETMEEDRRLLYAA